MTKKLQEVALSFFLIACGTSLLLGLTWIKPVIDAQKLLIEETRANQEIILQGANTTKEIVTELGYAVAVIAMLEERMIQPADANKMIEQSLKTIESKSERLGKLAKIVNDYRINHMARR